MLIKAASKRSALGMCYSTTCSEHPLEIFPSGVSRLTHSCLKHTHRLARYFFSTRLRETILVLQLNFVCFHVVCIKVKARCQPIKGQLAERQHLTFKNFYCLF